MTTNSARSWFPAGRMLARLSLILNAAFLVTLGVSILSTPMALPVTVGLWLGAAAMVALALLTPLES